jgi:hypothetical protein
MIGVELRHPKIREFALERERLVAGIAHLIGFYPIQPGSFGHETSLLFPVGRPDRAYVLFQPWPDPVYGSQSEDVLCCYQRTRRGITLVYKIDLKLADPRKYIIPVEPTGNGFSLLSYLMSQQPASRPANADWDVTHYDLHSSLTSTEIKDLAKKGTYVEYYAEVPDGGFRVSIVSNDENSSIDGLYEYNYDPDPAIKRLNPIALARLRPYGFDFLKEYGLPPAFAELKLLAQ